MAIINEVAWIAGNDWGLLAKPNGNHGAQPQTGILCSVDWLVNKRLKKGLDCLVAAPSSTDGTLGIATPTWHEGEDFDLDRWVEPVKT